MVLVADDQLPMDAIAIYGPNHVRDDAMHGVPGFSGWAGRRWMVLIHFFRVRVDGG